MGLNRGLTKRKKILSAIFKEAIKAASPRSALENTLTLKPVNAARPVLKINDSCYDLNKYKNLYVLGAGKAATEMAFEVERKLGALISGGCIVTKYGHGRRLKKIEVIEGGHPLPDRRGLEGANRLVDITKNASGYDLIIFLLSGGASALLPRPIEGITLKEKQAVTALLLNSGATINEMNAVRKHLSCIKGGMLMKAFYPATVVTLSISDVVANDLSTIGSGPTAPDPTTYEDCTRILKKYGLMTKVPKAVRKRFERGVNGLLEETPKPGDPIFRRTENIIIADNLSALKAAKKKAEALGFNTLILTSMLSGDTRCSANLIASIVKEIRKSGNPTAQPACLLVGGETTLEVKGKGVGGRNQEFALVAALELDGLKGVTLLSAGTDGTDGPTDAAGAFAGSSTLSTAKAKGLDPHAYLAANDSYNFFKQADGLFITGPTGTNVMDMVTVLVE